MSCISNCFRWFQSSNPLPTGQPMTDDPSEEEKTVVDGGSLIKTMSRWEVTNSFRSAGASVVGHEAVLISLVVLGVFLALSVSFIKNPRGAKGPPQWKGAAIGLGAAVGLVGIYHVGPLALQAFRALVTKCNERRQAKKFAEDEVVVEEEKGKKNEEVELKLPDWNWKKKTGAVLGSTWWLAALVVSGAIMGCMVGIGAGSINRRFRTDLAVFKRVMIATTVSGVAGNVLLAGALMTVITYSKHRNLIKENRFHKMNDLY